VPTLRSILSTILRFARLGIDRGRDFLVPSFGPCGPGLVSLVDDVEARELRAFRQGESSAALVDLYLAHRFDVLGSGWQDWTRERCVDRVNLANRKAAARIRAMLSPRYRPIDWHRDPGATHRWRPSRWSRFIRPGIPKGVDIKRPWELSRMQHLPCLALFGLNGAVPQVSLDRAAVEFQDEVLDFLASNPPRFGVNWRTPMDVAIRAANWVLAYSLLKSGGYRFDSIFEETLSGGLRDHGRHILRFIEWDPVWRANHYLANVCGLVFVAAALPPSGESDAWFAFGVQELVVELHRQIQADGTVFEASTGYHRLSLEMATFATAVVLGCMAGTGLKRLTSYDHGIIRGPKPLVPAPMALYPLRGDARVLTPFPASCFERLARGAQFILDITKPNDCVPLIGDNDSGRFVRLTPWYEAMTWGEARLRFSNLSGLQESPGATLYLVERQRDHRHVVAAVGALLDDPRFLELASMFDADACVVRALSRGVVPRLTPDSYGGTRAVSHRPAGAGDGPLPGRARFVSVPLRDPSVLTGLVAIAYPDFGLYVFRSPRFFLGVRCGPIGQEGFGGHAHNDQLAVELNVDGADLITDAGVYRYTVDPEERRLYRSVVAHFAPRVGTREPGNLDLGPWRLGDEAQARAELFGNRCFQGSHVGFGPRVHRRVVIEDTGVVIADWGEGDLLPDDPAELLGRLNRDGCLVALCPGYGTRHA